VQALAKPHAGVDYAKFAAGCHVTFLCSAAQPNRRSRWSRRRRSHLSRACAGT